MEKQYNLSNAQNLILFTEQYYNSNINTIIGIIEFTSKINIGFLKKAINITVQKNEILRARISFENESANQYIMEFAPFEIDVIENINEEEYIQNMTIQNMNMFDNQLFDFKILKAKDRLKLLGKFHHIIADAWSVSLITNEIVNTYTMLLNNENVQNIEYPSYIEYLKNEREYINSNKYINDKEYWNSIFNEEPQIINIERKSIKAKRQEFVLNNELYLKIYEFCKINRISLYCLLLTAFQIYLSKAYNISDITIGTPYLNRKNFKEKNTIGMYVNTLPTRLIINSEEKVMNLLLENKRNISNNIRHQQYPYSEINNFVKHKHNVKTNLYNMLFSYQNAKDNSKTSITKYHTNWRFSGNIANPLEVHIHDRDDDKSLNILFDYQTDIFRENEIISMYNRYIMLIEQIVNEDRYIKELSITTNQDKNIILNKFNNTKKDFSKYFLSENIVNLINTNSTLKAIISEDESITYKQLAERVNKLTSYLNQSINEGENVGIFVKKNIDTIVGILAVLKLNCTIVPVDDTYPEQRIDFIIKNAGIKNLLYTERTIIQNKECNKISISYSKYINTEKQNNDNYKYNINNNLYIIYTSGSTGNPKPATISHKNMINLIAHQIETKELLFKDSNVLQFATMCFDVSYQEIFSALLTQSKLVLIDDAKKKDSIYLTDYIIKHKIDILFLPPRYLTYLLEENKREAELLNRLKYIITAGEQLIITKNIKRLIDKGVTIYNHYGPAETHVATTYKIDKNNSSILKPAIGKPISNSKVYILDENLNICPIGIIGEIYISGYSVGNGYYAQLELTNQKFVEDPFYKEYKMYKTGDLGKFDEYGNIHYLGRKDFQVKVNGYRIELEEVEKHISNLEYVNNVAVVAIKDENEKNRLVAFIEFGKEVTYQLLKKDLIKRIPKYMFPTVIKKVEKLPLNSNGKVDKKMLVANMGKYKTITSEHKYVAPKTNQQEIMLDIAKKVLKINEMGIKDDIFELGADSLLVIDLQIELAKNNINVNAQEIYDYPTIELLSEYLQNKNDLNRDAVPNKVDMQEVQVDLNNKNNILVTGATGFLGIHILNYLLEKTNKTIYCIVRQTRTQTAEQRLMSKYKYYFDTTLKDKLNNRIHILAGDLLEKYFSLDIEQYNRLVNNIDIVINAAASVKHYAKREYNFKYNVETTRNIIEFAKKSNALLNHISTVGLAGNNLVDTNNCIKKEYNETDLYIGQKYWNNVYLDTKLQAELLIINEIKKQNVNANIMRIGNLMNRYTDNRFQQNQDSNAFQNKIMAICKIKEIPKKMLNFTFDLTPVDICAEAICKLVNYNKYNNVYHVLNSTELSFDDILGILSKLGIKISITDTTVNYLTQKWLINDIMINNKQKIKINSNKTLQTLHSLGFEWKIDKSYYENVLKSIIEGEEN